ncbi:MAG: DNA primase [Flavobacteriaceae bacterium]|nr:DNA primase [Flavobacteriaceae bacterium]
MISKTTIDQVFDTARVEEVIGDFVQLKKSGSNYKGLSPFSEERTPSFMVSPVKQIWKDFSSGKGGNVVAFLMEHEHFTYPEAIKYLAKKYGIEIEETEQSAEAKEEANERESLYLVNEFARDYFAKTLLETETGKAIGHSYFKERGFTEATIKKFQLGYSPDEWDAFTSEALKNGYQLSYLEKTGLTIVKTDKQFDRFKGRVIFPIHSLSGRVLGFGGRILVNDKKAAKYLNSPESEVYHKSKVLYGIYFAKQAIAKEDNCYLVEGYTDVIQFHQTGIENVVSSSGTALTQEQIRLIHRLTKNITLLFDGDAAGLRASLRGVDLILEQGLNVKICTFPEGEDPDSFAKNNSLEDLTLYLEENARDFINFKASLLASEAKNDPIKKAETIRDMVMSISKIPDSIKQEVYLKECSRIMDISEEVLFTTLAQMLQKERRDASKKEVVEGPTLEVVSKEIIELEKVDLKFELEKEIIDILINFGLDICEINEELIDFSAKEVIKEKHKKDWKICEYIYLNLQEDEIEFVNYEFKYLYNSIIDKLLHNINIDLNTLFDGANDRIRSMLSSMLFKYDEERIHNWQKVGIYPKPIEVDVPRKVQSCIMRLRYLLLQELIDNFSVGINVKKDSERTEIMEIINQYSGLKIDMSTFLGGAIPQRRSN